MNPSAPSPDSHFIVEGSDPASAHYSDAHGSYEPKPKDLDAELDIEHGSYEPKTVSTLALDQRASAPDTDNSSRVLDADPPVEPVIALDPTRETYNDLQRAFDFFNAELFDGRLTPCLITVRANGRKGGYFSANRFAHPDGRLTHEIALNIELYASQTIEYCLSILVHEMAHLAQHQDGTASRRRYHNRAFADLMGGIGLPTSNTGRPGGASVGEQMTHYIQGGGRFIVACRKLVDDGFRARWADRFFRHRRVEWIEDPSSPTVPVTQDGINDPQLPQPGSSGVVPADPGAAVDGEPHQPPDPPAPRHAGGEPSLINQNPALFQRTVDAKRSAQSKTKFQCACCLAAAWGKPSLKIMCMTCGAQMLPEDSPPAIATPTEPAHTDTPPESTPSTPVAPEMHTDSTESTDLPPATVISAMLYTNPALGRLAGPPSLGRYYLGIHDDDEVVPPSSMLSDGLKTGWKVHCGSVFDEAADHPDPDVQDLHELLEDRTIIASFAGAPHTISLDEAMSLYRKKGWVEIDSLRPDPSREDFSGVICLFRQTVVLHDLHTPLEPLALGTAEFRVVDGGAGCLIIARRFLGMAILDTPLAKPWSFFLGHVLGWDLGDEQSNLGYRPEPGGIFLRVEPDHPKGGAPSALREASSIAIDEFSENFSSYALSSHDIEMDDWRIEGRDPSEPHSDAPLANRRIHYLDDAKSFVKLAPVLSEATHAALAKLVETQAAPGLALCMSKGRQAQSAASSTGLASATRAAKASRVVVGDECASSDNRAISIKALEVDLGDGKDVISTFLTTYLPVRDRHPFDTLDSEEFPSLDVAEAIHPGLTHGEGHAYKSLDDLGYERMLREVFIACCPRDSVPEARVKPLIASMLRHAASLSHSESAFIFETYGWAHQDASDPGAKRRFADQARLAKGLQDFGFEVLTAGAYALSAAAWAVVRAAVAETVPRDA